MKHIAVLGAGICGLSLAWRLKKKYRNEAKITLFEKTSRAGGWIETIEKEGFLFEQGPRSCRPQGAGIATLQLIEELNLQSEVLGGKLPNRYLLYNQKLEKVPSDLISFLTSPLTRRHIPAILRECFKKSDFKEDETIFDFFSRRFSSDFAMSLIDPFVSGIFAGDIRELSIRSCFPYLHENGCVVRSFFKRKKSDNLSRFVQANQKYNLFTFKNGMETLTKRLSQELTIIYNQTVSGIDSLSDHAVVRLATGENLHFDHVYTTLADKEVPTSSIAVVNFGYHRDVLKNKGFGYLVPSKENEKILGVVFDSSAFPMQNKHPEETRLTVMVGEKYLHDPLTVAGEALSKHLSIDAMPDVTHVKIAKNAIPQYPVGHWEWLKRKELNCKPHITFLGSSYYGVSVNDTIKKNQISV